AHVLALLARYDALGGHGYQAALPGRAFDVLLECLGTNAECFASPLNCRYERFCSAFPDVDTPFGSWGSFFSPSFTPTKGSFEANPPFVPEVMLAMVEKMDALLAATNEPLSFVIIVPAWTEIPAWKALTSSKFRQAEVVIVPKQDHSFCDGAQVTPQAFTREYLCQP
ncbi:phosphorylated CTD interacting factor 1, WW domain-containing protein, partial [Baffinella frigidus]